MYEFVGDGIYNAGGAGGGGPQDIGTWETITNDCTWNTSFDGRGMSYLRKIMQYNEFISAIRFYVQIAFSSVLSSGYSLIDIVTLPSGYSFAFPFKISANSYDDTYHMEHDCLKMFTNLSGQINAPQTDSVNIIRCESIVASSACKFMAGGGVVFVYKA